jgi:DNA-directed RNA polymerase specialized sigma24 family protein
MGAKKAVVYYRDWSDGYSVSEDLELIKKAVLIHRRKIFGRWLANDQFEDLVQQVYLKMYERQVWRRWNPEEGPSYWSYLSEAVHNYLVDLARSNSMKLQRHSKSLNQPVAEDSSINMIDAVVDETIGDIAYMVENKGLLGRFWARVKEMDSGFGTGLYNVTYADVFKALLGEGPSVYEIEKSLPRKSYSKTHVKWCVRMLQKKLAEVI